MISGRAERLLPRPEEVSTHAGAAVMAIGIFLMASFRQLPGASAAALKLLAAGLLVLWLYLAISYLSSGLAGRTREPANRFAIGTWVAGTVVLGQTLAAAFAGWELLEAALGATALACWLWLLTLLPGAYRAVMGNGCRGATGAVLLPTVSTQAVVISASSLFTGRISSTLAVVIVVGCLFYAFGVLLIARRYLFGGRWRLADNWHNTNCILHGAMSITGLASVQSGVIPAGWILLMWLWSAAMLALVESMEAARLIARVRAYGFGRGVFVYHVSQWSRNFTFGMFYAFTLGLGQSPAGTLLREVPDPLMSVQRLIAGYGQYVVLLFVLLEIALAIFRRLTGDHGGGSHETSLTL